MSLFFFCYPLEARQSLPLPSTVTRGVTSRSGGVLNGKPATTTAAHEQLSSRSSDAMDRALALSTGLLESKPIQVEIFTRNTSELSAAEPKS